MAFGPRRPGFELRSNVIIQVNWSHYVDSSSFLNFSNRSKTKGNSIFDNFTGSSEQLDFPNDLADYQLEIE